MNGVKRRRYSILLFVIILVASVGVGVTFFSSQSRGHIAKGATLVWETTFGRSGDDRAFYAASTFDDGYLIVGSSTSFEQGKTVACIVKLDSRGNHQWNKTYSENIGAEFRYAQAEADGFLLVGNTFLASGGTSGYILKADNQGNTAWYMTVNPPVDGRVNKLFSAVKDGTDLIVIGLTESFGDNTGSNVWAIKLGAEGNVVWNKIFGGTAKWAGRGITVTQDNSYMVAGYVCQSLTDNYDFLVLNLDKNGNMIWNHTFGGIESDKAYSIATVNGGCIVAGDTRSQGSGDSDAWIIKISLAGEKIWERTIGGSNFDSPTYVAALPEGRCVVAGTTFSYGNGLRDYWLLQLGDTGEVISNCSIGRDNYEEAYAALPTGNSTYIMAGWTKSLGAGHYDFYVVKLEI